MGPSQMHMKGHTACSKAYDISRYPEYVGLNSQLAEQQVRCSSYLPVLDRFSTHGDLSPRLCPIQNAKIATLRGHAAYMTQQLFMLYMRFYLYKQATRR